jgi:hypothetical protein
MDGVLWSLLFYHRVVQNCDSRLETLSEISSAHLYEDQCAIPI